MDIRKDKNSLELLKLLTTFDTNKLYKFLVKFLFKHGYKKIKRKQHFILAEGSIPICLIAHMDTVFSWNQNKDNFIYDPEKQILWGIGGSGFDDRAGIAAIIELIKKGYHPHVIFTDLEEVGGIGAEELVSTYTKCPFKNCKFLIELDRANQKDAVYYRCKNEKFEECIESFGFEFAYGSFSDISIIAPAWKIAAVNLSIGFCFEHTSNEILHIDWLNNTINKVEQILINSKNMKHYDYISKEKYNYNNCLICNQKLTNKNKIEIYDDIYPYLVCKQCYDKYYILNEED